jgi:hypothetical protein
MASKELEDLKDYIVKNKLNITSRQAGNGEQER